MLFSTQVEVVVELKMELSLATIIPYFMKNKTQVASVQLGKTEDLSVVGWE